MASPAQASTMAMATRTAKMFSAERTAKGRKDRPSRLPATGSSSLRGRRAARAQRRMDRGERSRSPRMPTRGKSTMERPVPAAFIKPISLLEKPRLRK